MGGHWTYTLPGPGLGPNDGIPTAYLNDPYWSVAWKNPGFVWVFDANPYLWQLPQGGSGTPGYVNPAGSSSNADANGWLPIVFGARKIKCQILYAAEQAYYFWQCIAVIGEGEIGSIGRVWCNGHEIGNGTAGGFNWAFYPGTPTGTHNAFTDAAADAGVFPPYTSASPEMAFPNTAYLNIQVSQSDTTQGWGKRIPGGSEKIEFEVEVLTGRKIYDLRDGAQDPDDPTTWTVSTNPALAIYDICSNPRWKAAYPTINAASFTAAANVCDTMVGSPSAKRFLCNDLIAERADIGQHIAQICLACNGELYNGSNGVSLFIDVESAASPVLALDTATNFRDVRFEVLSVRDQPTQIVATYDNAAIDYEEDTIRIPKELADGVELREASYTFSSITDAVHATRACAYILKQNVATPVRASGTVSQAGIVLQRGSKVSVTTSDGPAVAPFLVNDAELMPEGSYSVILRQYDAAVYTDEIIDHQIPIITTLGPPFAPLPDIRVRGHDTDSADWPRDYKLRWELRSRLADTLFSDASFWAISTPGSAHTPDPSKVNDGNTSTIAFGFDAGPGTVDLDTHALGGGDREFIGAKLIWPASVDLTTADLVGIEPLVWYSDDGSSWTDVYGGGDSGGSINADGGIRQIFISSVWRGMEQQWDAVGAHRYWRLAGGGSADATRVWTELQFIEAGTTAWTDSQIDRYEIHARTAHGECTAVDSTFMVIAGSSRPTIGAFIDFIKATYQTGELLPVYGSVASFLNVGVVAVLEDGRRSHIFPFYNRSFSYAATGSAGLLPIVDPAELAPLDTGFGGIAVSSIDGELWKGTAGGGWAQVSGLPAGGTVTSVDLTAPVDLLAVSGNPVTTAGTLALAKVSVAKNKAYMGPTTGSDADPAFRLLVSDDVKDVGPQVMIEHPAGVIDGYQNHFVLTYLPTSGRILLIVDSMPLIGGRDYVRDGVDVWIYGNAPRRYVMAVYPYQGAANPQGNPEDPPQGSATVWAGYAAVRDEWHDVAFAPELGMLAAVGGVSPGGNAMYSTDGTTWANGSILSQTAELSCMCWAPNIALFLAASSSGTAMAGRFATSPDGVNWTGRTGGAVPWRGMCWSRPLGIAVVVGDNTTWRSAWSSDGITYNVTTPPLRSWTDVCYSEQLGIFVAVASDAANDNIMTSPDGLNWTIQSTPSTRGWFAVCWSPELGLFAASGISGGSNTDRVITSPDGVNWTVRTTPNVNGEWRGICWSSHKHLFVAVGTYAGSTGTDAMTSPDGVVWTAQTTPSDSRFVRVRSAEALGLFVAVSAINNGTNPEVMISAS